jgi:DNA damage-inducible protein 1
MLKAHQACIDLEKGVLRIQGREVPFLAEHELPDKAKAEVDMALAGAGASASAVAGPSSAPQPQSFPGSGHTLGAAPQPGRGRGAPAAGAGVAQSRYSEETINTLMGLGVSREVAISTLDAAGGNIDVAASLLF